MKSKEYDVAIVGGGHNGLICAAYLAKAGLKVCVLEARHECGGGLDTLEVGGFRHNIHAVYHMMADLMPPYHDLDLGNKGAKFIYPDVQAAYISKKHKPLVFYKDPGKTVEYIGSTFSAKDGESYQRMYSEFAEYSEKIVMPLTYVPSMPPVDQVQLLDNARDDVGARFNEIAELTPVELLKDYDFGEPVKAALLNLFTMWGLSPYEALGFLFPLYVYRMTNAALCKGGSHRLCSALVRSVVEAGGEIIDNAEVVRVVLQNGAVAGVVTRSGLEIKAKSVASTVDPKQSFLKFFRPDEIPGDLAGSMERWEWEKSSLFGLHLALKEAPRYIGTDGCDDANRAMINFLGIHDTEALLDHCQSVEEGTLPVQHYGHTTTASLFDPIMAPPGMHAGRWESLVPFDCDWDHIASDYADKCLAEWKSWAPNLDPIHTYVYPPTFIETKLINMVRGSIKQGAYVPLQMGSFRPHVECSQGATPIEGFYLCGAGTYPGGMIIGGPGYIGANVIAEDLEVEKCWDEPAMVTAARDRGLIVDDE